MELSLKDKLFLHRYLLEIRLCKHNYYFIKNKALGDLVRTLSGITLFKMYHLKNKRAKIVVLTTENKVGMMEMNSDIDEIRVLSSNQLQILQDYCLDKGEVERLYRDSYHINELSPIYHLPQEFIDTNPEVTKLPKSIGKQSIAKAKKYLDEEGLDPNKTVLFVPYSSSASSLDPDIFKPVADYYAASGYRVLTNAFGNDHQHVEGTEPTCLPADVLLSVIQQGLTVIGVQSGLLDVCEWMHLTNKVIKVFVLKTKKDKYYYSNRSENTDQKIEEREWGYTIALSSEQDYADLADNNIHLTKLLDSKA